MSGHVESTHNRSVSDTTGNYLVVFHNDTAKRARNTLNTLLISNNNALEGDDPARAPGITFFESLDLAVVASDLLPALLKETSTSFDPPGGPIPERSLLIRAIEPERICYAPQDLPVRTGTVPPSSADPGSRARRVEKAGRTARRLRRWWPFSDQERVCVPGDESRATWGLQVTGVARPDGAPATPFSGKDVRVAILDSGIDFTVEAGGKRRLHPAFANREVYTESFIRDPNDPGPHGEDDHGHGTHCAGIACGSPLVGAPRYGIAHRSIIYSGRVLRKSGERVGGNDGWIIDGIRWAIKNKCQVACLALARRYILDGPFEYNLVYEHVARRALAAGLLLIAASGNEGGTTEEGQLRRVRVAGPANCPSVMAVGGLGKQGCRVMNESHRGLHVNGGYIDVAAPGNYVYSAGRASDRLIEKSGTSAATAHVAGIAALHAEAYHESKRKWPDAGQLWELVVGTAAGLDQPREDVGAGLVQAPRG